MNSIFAFLSELNQQEIKLQLDNDQLRVNAPQGALTPELTTQLKARKSEIVAFLQRNHVAPTADLIQPAPRHAPLPLSFSQQRLWFLEQLGSGATYTIPTAFALEGVLNISALEQTLTEIVRRHESLRTTFVQDGAETRQVIHAPTPVAVPVLDLQQLSPIEQTAEVERLAHAETLRPFDLSSDLMLRATLLHLGSLDTSHITHHASRSTQHAPDNHILLLTLHHIAADGWSLGVLVHELMTLYAAFVQGEPSPLPDLPIQYVDFAVRQRNWLQGAVLEEQLTYWQRQLAGAPELLQLPTDFPRPAVQTFLANKVDFRIDGALTQGLRTLGQQAGATLFMTLLAAFQVLLARYSGQEDIVVDAPIANRTHKAIEPLIGFFVNDLALRADLAGNPTFLELLGQMRQTTQAAYAHQDLPFDRLVEALHPRRNLGYNPVAQVAFALQNAPMGDFALPDLHVRPLDLTVQQTRMDLEVHLWERGDRLDGSVIYNTDLFAAATIERMVSHFQTLLAGIVADPTQRIAELPLLTTPERHQILVDWNATQAATPDQCLHQLFEEQVARTPDAVAVIFADDRRLETGDWGLETEDCEVTSQSLTYAELNARANQLAHYLQAQGVGPETLVGICVDRSLEMVVGMLGILKAGGAYVPLDPAYPADRIAFIMEETQTPILLTQTHLLPELPAHTATTLALDSAGALLADYPTTNPTSAVAPHNLAYVIYTSGSTGKPKGVLIEHESVAAHCVQYQRFYALTPADRALQLASFHFDASVEQIFPALLTGAGVVVPEWDLDPVRFSQNLQRFGITILDLAGAHLRLLLQEWIKQPALIADSPLRIVVVGADVMPVDLITLWRQTGLAQTARLFNVYGPTETTVAATVFEITADFDAGQPRIPIGPPLANKQLYILDPERQPVPIGVPGELYIGGIGPARGYFKRPELTNEKFISIDELRLTMDEDSAHDATRKSKIVNRKFYRTGDLVRWLPDGNIDFLGRIDGQVKIRSFRVELGEIEAVLQHHPAVQEAAVTIWEDEQAQKRLVAYLTPHLPDTEILELRNYLKTKLPEYMVPDAFVPLDTFPRTPIGLLDRKALPAPGVIQSNAPYAPPGNATEQKLAALWTELLQRDTIGIHDNFFDVGGHSLLAMQVHSRLRAEYPTLQMVALFSYPTIHALAGHLGQSTNGAARQQADADRGAKRRAQQTARRRQRQVV